MDGLEVGDTASAYTLGAWSHLHPAHNLESPPSRWSLWLKRLHPWMEPMLMASVWKEMGGQIHRQKTQLLALHLDAQCQSSQTRCYQTAQTQRHQNLAETACYAAMAQVTAMATPTDVTSRQQLNPHIDSWCCDRHGL